MRIISGIYKSRILKSPVSENVRPTSDRAKETLFNVLSSRMNFEGKFCMDIFCGSGSLGLECISRGAAHCTFVDKDLRAVKSNIILLNAGEKCQTVISDALNFLNVSKEQKADLIFCDPPYSYNDYDKLLNAVSEFNAVVVLEHSGKFVPDKSFEKFTFQRKKTGNVYFTFFDFKK